MSGSVKTIEVILTVATTSLTAVGVSAATWTNPRSYLGETWSYLEDESGVCVLDVHGGRYESGDGTLSFDMSLYDFPGTINSVEGFWNERWDGVDFRYLTTLRCFGFKAFYACPNLTSVLGVSSGVTNIGAYAFANCGNLSMCNIVQEITKGGGKGITKGLKSIGAGAFSNCGFAWVTIPSTVDRIGELAFSECSGLRYAYVPTTCEIAANAFSGCHKDFQLLKYKPNQVVKFVDRGQTIFTRTINYGECYGDLPKPIRDDWVFVGWEIEGNVIGDQSICYQLDDHVFTAVWKQTAVMAFDANGGIGSVTNEQDCATTLSIPKVSREGYTLLGWSPTPPDLVPESNMTFIAQWRINNYKVIFDSNGGSGGVTNIQTYASDIIAPHVERWGCIFDGWIPDVCPIVPASNVTYTARWKVCEVVLDSVEQGMSTLYPKDYQTVQTVYLPAGIARIPSFFFAGCSSLTKVSIPDSVTEIDYYAFDGCDALIDTVTIPGVKIVDGWVVGYTAALNENLKLNGVRGIASYAFNRCTGLKDITIGDGVKGIGWLAFDDCFGLTNVTISAGVTNIADGAFSGCTNVTSLTASAIPGYMPREKLITVNIPDGITHIGGFAGCTGLKNVAIPDSVTDIGGAAFGDCSALKEIVMPKGLKRIGDYAFERCVSIKSIEVPDGVETIGEYVFAGCTNLQTVTIPSSVKSKPYGWFNGCDSLRSVVIPGHIGMTGYGKFVEEITISRGSTNICDCAFEGCINITNISIPDEVVSIGRRAFGDCDKLESIYMPNGVKSIGDSAFSGCASLSNATIPGSVTNIGVSLFWGCPGIIDAKVPQCVLDRGLQNVFPDSYATITNVSYSSVISRIPERAFYGCAKLKSVVVPEGVQCIGKSAFEECEDLEEVVLPESVVIIEECAFRGCKNLKNMPIPNNVGSIGWGAFDGCCSLTTLTIPNTLTNIGERAFQGCSSLTRILIPDRVTSIGDDAFHGCTGLTDVSLPANFTSVWAFGDCTNVVRLSAPYLPRGVGSGKLSSVVVPEDVTNIVDSAFYGCSSLTNVIIPSSVKRIGNSAFGDCSSLTDVNIPDSAEEIGGHAFVGCYGLTNVTIGVGVKSICDRAFADCSNLKNIFVPDSVESIGEGAFSGCSSLANMVLPFVGSCRGSESRFGYDGEDLFGWIFGWSSYDGGNEVEQFYGVGQCMTYWIPASLRCVEITDEKEIGVGAFHNCSELTSVILHEGVTRIGAWAFGNCSGLRTMIVPNSVRTNDGAFSGCMFDKIIMPGHLEIGDVSKDIEISEGSTFIAAGAFHGYSRLRSVTIPNAVTNIGYGAFYDCKWITDIVIPKGVRTIDGQAFYDCTGLKSLSIMNPDVQFTGGATFGGCTNLSDVTLPGWDCGIPFAFGSVTNVVITPGTISIAGGAFRDCSTIRRVSIPDSVTDVGDSAFAGCSAIERLTIPQSVCSEGLQKVFPDAYAHIHEIEILEGTRSIGQNAFAGCEALSTISIPSSVSSSADFAFSGCVGIERVDIADFSAWLKIRFGVEANPLSVSKAVLYLNGEPLTIEGTFVVTNDVVTIPDYAFRNQTRLTNIVLPDGLTRIGAGAFDGCASLTSINLPDTLTDWGLDSLPPAMREEFAYDANGLMIYNGWLLDYQNKSVSSLVVPEGIVGIGAGALAGMYDLETVNLPQSLKYIAEGAFREDTYLDNLVIPDGVEIIGDGAFEDCSFLQTMALGGGVKNVGARSFAGCTQLSGAVFADGLLDVGALAFKGCWRMQSVSLPLSTTNVASSAFSGCTSLTGVTTPTHGGKMSEWFAPVYSQIRDVTVPEGEVEVRASMFEGCVSLQTVQMPDSITNIAARAFYGCSSLPEVRLPESLMAVGGETFRNCLSLTAAALPENVTCIGARAFQGCSNLSALTLPRGLEALPDYVFADCWSLDSFVVPAAVTNLGNYIVSGSTTAIYYLGNAPAYGANVYGNASGSLKSYVILGTKGWDGRPNSRDIPASWNGCDILTWSANQFDVTFDANGGLFFPVVTNTYACEEITYTGYSLPPFEPVRKGMDFDGYWTEPNGGTRVFTSTQVLLTKPHTLYSHWKKGATIKVRFNACGGTVLPAEDDYVAERPYCELPVPVCEHFVFDGWWTEANGGSRVEISSEAPKAAHELFAHWMPASHKIRFHANNGTDASVDQYFTYGDTVTLRANSFGYGDKIFVGWALSEDGPAVYADGKTLTDVAAIQDNVIHLYAVWVSTRYTVRFDSHGGVGRMENQTLVKDTAAALYGCAFTRTGYTFAGWAVSTTGVVVYGDGERVVNVYEKTGANVVLYAVWEPIIYSIHYSANGGIGTMADQSMTYDKSVRLAAVSFVKDGAVFKGWSTAENGAMVYPDGVSVKNLASIDGAVVTLYAVWLDEGAPWPLPKPEPVLEPELYDEDEIVGAVPVAAASEYNGYLYDEKSGAVKGTIQVKVGKPGKKDGKASVKATVVVGTKKVSLKAVDKSKAVINPDGSTEIELVGKGAEECVVSLGAEGLSGTYGPYQIDGARNFFASKDKGEQDAANGILAKWSGPVNVVWNGGNASVTIAKKGKVKAAVTLADGTKATANAQLLVGEEWLCVPIVVTKKMNLAFTLWLPRNGGAAVVEGLPGDVSVGKAGALRVGARFHVDKSAALWSHIAGKVLTDYLPDGMEVTQSGAKWTLPKAGKVVYLRGGASVDESKLGRNPSALKLAYKAKDGSFKGSFKVYAENGGKLKATKVNVAGVMVNGVGYGTATIKNVGSVAIEIR